jgi:hypothetical protein
MEERSYKTSSLASTYFFVAKIAQQVPKYSNTEGSRWWNRVCFRQSGAKTLQDVLRAQ